MTTQPTNPLIAARRNDSDRRRRKVLDALDRLRIGGQEITVSAVARTAYSSSTTVQYRSPDGNLTRKAPTRHPLHAGRYRH